MRVAILISGAYRTLIDIWEQNEIVLNKQGFDYDVYFQSWKEDQPTFRSVIGSVSKNRFSFKFAPLVYENSFDNSEILNFLSKSNWVFQLDDFGPFLKDSKTKLIELENDYRLINAINTLGMYEGMRRVVNLVKSKNSYSHFMRIRPDFQLNEEWKFIDTEDEIVMDGPGISVNGKMVSDQCFHGRIKFIESMNVIENLNLNLNKLGWFYNSNTLRTGETAFFENLIYLNIKFGNRITPKNQLGKIVRPKTKTSTELSFIGFWSNQFRHNLEVLNKKLVMFLIFIKYKIILRK